MQLNNVLKFSNARKLFAYMLLSSLIVTITGCSNSTSDLEAWINEVKARPQKTIDPIPEVFPYRAFTYNKESKRDPFDDSIFRLTPKASDGKRPASTISPDPNRVPEYLESFPLDTLRMVGTMSQDQAVWALIQTPDNTIQRVEHGNYLGQNNGKIVEVSNDGIELKEIIPDGFGGWQERASSIALSE